MKIEHIDLDRQVFIIAEVGNCHEGSIQLAEDMIGLAARAGADAVKFQTIIPRKLVSSAEKDRIAQLEKFCLTYDQFQRLKKTAANENILFMSTPFDLQSLAFLTPIVPAIKIASGDMNFTDLLIASADTAKPIILSCGASSETEVEESIGIIKKRWNDKHICQDLAVLHCVVAYPTDPSSAHLRFIPTLQKFGVTVGYSDHTIGIDASVLSVALGARIVEKHFTIRNDYSDFRDHKLAADPADFKRMVERIRNAEVLLGSSDKRVLPAEIDNRARVRRSAALVSDLTKGITLKKEHITCLRPGVGVPANQLATLIGRTLNRDMRAGEIITMNDIVS